MEFLAKLETQLMDRVSQSLNLRHFRKFWNEKILVKILYQTEPGVTKSSSLRCQFYADEFELSSLNLFREKTVPIAKLCLLNCLPKNQTNISLEIR
jgi:hypothetical protein